MMVPVQSAKFFRDCRHTNGDTCFGLPNAIFFFFGTHPLDWSCQSCHLTSHHSCYFQCISCSCSHFSLILSLHFCRLMLVKLPWFQCNMWMSHSSNTRMLNQTHVFLSPLTLTNMICWQHKPIIHGFNIGNNRCLSSLFVQSSTCILSSFCSSWHTDCSFNFLLQIW